MTPSAGNAIGNVKGVMIASSAAAASGPLMCALTTWPAQAIAVRRLRHFLISQGLRSSHAERAAVTAVLTTESASIGDAVEPEWVGRIIGDCALWKVPSGVRLYAACFNKVDLDAAGHTQVVAAEVILLLMHVTLLGKS